MKPTTLITMLLLSSQLSFPLFAESGPAYDPQKMEEKSKERVEKRLEKMTKELKLTTDQQATVKAALEDERSKMTAINKEFAEKHKAVREEGDVKINAVLSDEQKAKYVELKEKVRDHRKHQLEKKKK